MKYSKRVKNKEIYFERETADENILLNVFIDERLP